MEEIKPITYDPHRQLYVRMCSCGKEMTYQGRTAKGNAYDAERKQRKCRSCGNSRWWSIADKKRFSRARSGKGNPAYELPTR